MKRSLIGLSSLMVGLALSFAPNIAMADEPFRLIFTSFRGNGEDGLHLAASDDGYTWTVLKGDKPFLASKVGGGLMRDPNVITGPDGTYHLVWTTAWNKHGIGYAHSKDLIHWSELKLLDVMKDEPKALNVWAPEVAYDAKARQFVIFWSSTIPGRFPDGEKNGDNGYNHRIYATTTVDFGHFSPAVLLFEPGHNVIDATIARDEAHDRYLLFFKDETRTPPAKNLHLAMSSQIMGPYEPLRSRPITGAYWAEGPTAIQLGDTWFVYFDRYTEQRYGLITSKDLKVWRDESDRVHFPRDFRHGSVLQVPRAVLEHLRGER